MSNALSLSATMNIAEVADIKVHTTSNRGHNPDELSEMCLDRLIYVGENVEPVLRQQALEYRSRIKLLLMRTIEQAQRSERTTVCAKLEEAGFSEAAAYLRNI